MLNIDRKDLLYLLETKRKIIERPKLDGLGEIIASISLMATLSLSDYSNLPFRPLYFQIGAWGIAIIIFVFGAYTIVKNTKEPYTIEKLYSEISDLDPKMEHRFNVVIIRRPGGDYLVFDSKRWGCWLFPNYHCSGNDFDENREREQVIKNIKRDLNEELSFILIGDMLSHKYSVGDKVMKKYHFYFFQATEPPRYLRRRPFKSTINSNGKQYCWKTLDQLYANSKTIKRNKDVLDFIRNTCDIS